MQKARRRQCLALIYTSTTTKYKITGIACDMSKAVRGLNYFYPVRTTIVIQRRLYELPEYFQLLLMWNTMQILTFIRIHRKITIKPSAWFKGGKPQRLRVWTFATWECAAGLVVWRLNNNPARATVTLHGFNLTDTLSAVLLVISCRQLCEAL